MNKEIMTEEELKDLIKKLNERLYAWDDKMLELQEEIVDIFDKISDATGPIVRDYYRRLATKVNHFDS